MLRTVVRSGSLVCVALLAIGAAPPPRAEPDSAPVTAMPVEALKQVYLACERSAVAGSLGADAIMQCSVVYEELKRRAFDGDYRRLKAWADTTIGLEGAGDGDPEGQANPPDAAM